MPLQISVDVYFNVSTNKERKENRFRVSILILFY